MRRAAMTALVVTLAMVSFATAASAKTDIAPGFVSGREHEVRVRPVMVELPPAKRVVGWLDGKQGAAAVVSCDPARVEALAGAVPTSTRDDDARNECVVLPLSSRRKARRLLLGPAPFGGSELGNVVLRPTRPRRRNVAVVLSTRGQARWTFFGRGLADRDLAFTLDGELVDLAPVEDENGADAEGATIVLGGRRGFPRSDAKRIRDLVEEAEQEEVIELARAAFLNPSARGLFGRSNPVIREKATFAADCPLPEAKDTFVLGCYDGSRNLIFILRVDRTDLTGVMTVTAAHELLHAAYDNLSLKERRKVDKMIADFIAATPIPRVEESIALYDEAERANELHSLLGTEVLELSPGLERYYSRYFEDRAALVTTFQGYQRVFDELEARYKVLDFELAGLEKQIRSIDGQIDAAIAEAESLGMRIDELRAQGQFEDANALVLPQNAAVNHANELIDRYNSLVEDYNEKVEEANGIARSLGDLYQELTPITPE